MELNGYLEEFGDNDVIYFEPGIFNLGKFKDAVKKAFTHPNRLPKTLYSSLYENGVASSQSKELFGEGVDCELLKVGTLGWQSKGKIRIRVSLEFIPDELEHG